MRGISIFRHTLHAISGQRYHDNTPPPPSLQRNLMQSWPWTSRFRRFFPARAGREEEVGERGERWEERDLTRVPSTTATTKTQILHEAETPQSRRIVASRRAQSFFFFASIVLASAHNGTKACSSLSLGDSARVRREKRRTRKVAMRRRGEKIPPRMLRQHCCVTVHSGPRWTLENLLSPNSP